MPSTTQADPTNDDIEALIATWVARVMPLTIGAPQSPVPPIDRRMLERLDALDPHGHLGLVRNGIEQFVATTPGTIAEVEDALARGDLAEVEGIAHRLQGRCGGYGAFRLMALAAEIESRARRGTAAGLDVLVPRLTDEFVAARSILGGL